MTASQIPEVTEAEFASRAGVGRSAPDPAWVPAEACLLPTEDRPFRLAEFEDLFATAVSEIDRPEPTRLRLVLDPEPAVAARVAGLAAREADCCRFFTFTLTAAGDELTLEVSVPEERTGVLDGLADQAEAAGASV